jgi:hypothetical protein
VTRWRWKTPTKKGRWLPTALEAREAAAKAGVASRDERSGVVYLDALTEIESEDT